MSESHHHLSDRAGKPALQRWTVVSCWFNFSAETCCIPAPAMTMLAMGGGDLYFAGIIKVGWDLLMLLRFYTVDMTQRPRLDLALMAWGALSLGYPFTKMWALGHIFTQRILVGKICL